MSLISINLSPFKKRTSRYSALQFTLYFSYKDGFTAQEVEGSSELVKKALRLNNASNDEIFKFRLEQAIKKFQKFPNDTGTPAVQSKF